MRQICVVAAILMIAACGEVPQQTIDAAPETDAAVDPCTQPELSIDDFFVCLGRSVCDVYEDCFASDTSFMNCDALPLQVFGRLSPEPLKVVIKDAVESGRAQWNPAQAKACIDLVADNANGKCSIFKNDGDVFATCGAVVGNVTNGQPCQNDIECATQGARCENQTGSGDQCTGYVCRAPVAAGQMCINGAFCRPGDHCVARRAPGGADSSICATGASGEVCDRDADCDVGLFCNGGTGDSTAAGICTAAKPAGATCRVDEECASDLLCVGNLGGANGTCRDVRTPGAMCDRNASSEASANGCWGRQYCDASTTAVGTCKPAPSVNEACGTIDGTPTFCGFFSPCEMGSCRAPGNLGDPCTTSSNFGSEGCNLGLFCDRDLTMAPTGICQERLANGSQCRPNSSNMTTGASRMCLSEWCSNGVCTDFPTCF
ncbi:MAG TPA: Dickkopf N-terminal cysteine-rich domain-containing protein [Kofleriaceae bacterium]|nr:Dickkopf N-terminal cysteine-rich domain-containing protein [Kofleriaceae bacterium]